MCPQHCSLGEQDVSHVDSVGIRTLAHLLCKPKLTMDLCIQLKILWLVDGVLSAGNAQSLAEKLTGSGMTVEIRPR